MTAEGCRVAIVGRDEARLAAPARRARHGKHAYISRRSV
ncbi:MAG: hypothetical protein WDN29_04650 [Methylovirgula sp.]